MQEQKAPPSSATESRNGTQGTKLGLDLGKLAGPANLSQSLCRLEPVTNIRENSIILLILYLNLSNFCIYSRHLAGAMSDHRLPTARKAFVPLGQSMPRFPSPFYPRNF